MRESLYAGAWGEGRGLCDGGPEGADSNMVEHREDKDFSEDVEDAQTLGAGHGKVNEVRHPGSLNFS